MISNQMFRIVFVSLVQLWCARAAVSIVSLKSAFLLRTQPILESSNYPLSITAGPGAL